MRAAAHAARGSGPELPIDPIEQRLGAALVELPCKKAIRPAQGVEIPHVEDGGSLSGAVEIAAPIDVPQVEGSLRQHALLLELAAGGSPRSDVRAPFPIEVEMGRPTREVRIQDNGLKKAFVRSIGGAIEPNETFIGAHEIQHI